MIATVFTGELSTLDTINEALEYAPTILSLAFNLSFKSVTTKIPLDVLLKYKT